MRAGRRLQRRIAILIVHGLFLVPSSVFDRPVMGAVRGPFEADPMTSRHRLGVGVVNPGKTSVFAP